MGSQQTLPNGNLLINIATGGIIKEFDPAGNLLWSKTATGATPKAFRYDSCYVFNLAPAIPVVSNVNDTLYSTQAVTYQWYFNGYQIAGATSQFYVPTQSGNYKVRITDSNGCVLQYSSDFDYTTPSAVNEPYSPLNFNAYPNPTTGLVMIQHNRINDFFEIMVNDATGKQVMKTENVNYIDLSELEQGIYFITLRTHEGIRETKRISYLKP